MVEAEEKIKERKNKLREGAKWNPTILQMAPNLIALGFTEDDLGAVLGASKRTIQTWKRRHPTFKKACKEGRNLANVTLTAQMLRAAIGYDYEETEKVYKPKYTGAGNNILVVDEETGQPIETLVERKVKTKHQKGDARLMEFLACNRLPEYFNRDWDKDTVVKDVAELTGTTLANFFGKWHELCEKKHVESRIIEGTEGVLNGVKESPKTNT